MEKNIGKCPKCGCENKLRDDEIEFLKSGIPDFIVFHCIGCGTALAYQNKKKPKK